MSEEIVRMENISKKFGRVQALEGVDLKLNKGEILGLVGDNGAGKSTLIKILCGLIKSDSGKIFFKGKETKIDSPKKAIKMGIETIHQDFNLVDQLNIVRNIFLGHEVFKKIGFIKVLDMDSMRKESIKLLNTIGIKKDDPNAPVTTLSGGEKQSVTIARAMYFKAHVLILDEPTNQLSVKESKYVFDFVKSLKKQGVSNIFITHNIYQVFQVADRIMVLSHGGKIADLESKQTSPEDISEMILKS